MKFSLILLLLCISCSFDVDDNPEEINPNSYKIGVVTEITQTLYPTTAGGIGALMARDEINAAGGINGYPVEIIARDSACISETGVAEGRKLIEEHDIVAIIGPSCSSTAFLMINELLPAYQIPAIATTTTSPDLTTLDADDLFYRLQASDLIAIDTLAAVALDDGVSKLGVIYRGGNDVFNSAIAEGLANKFAAEAGKQVVSLVSYPETAEIDFSDAIDTLFDEAEQEGGMDALAIIGFAVDTANVSVAIRQEMRNRSISLETISSVYVNNIEENILQSGSKELLDGAVAVPTADISNATAPNLASWRSRFNQLFVDDRSENSLGYDAMYLLALALLNGGMDASNSATEARLAIKDNLRLVSGTGGGPDVVEIKPGEFSLAIDTLNAGGQIDYNGASGSIDFDSAGDVNYGDFKVVTYRREGSVLTIQCLKKIRLFPSGAGYGNEFSECDPETD